MAQIRYFKKLIPQTRVVLSNNAALQFTSLDTVTGYFATDSQGVQQEFERFMREQRYGISEISAEEFKANYLEKKNLPQSQSNRNWREEWGRGSQGSSPIVRLGTQAVAAAVGVKASDVPGAPRVATTLETPAPAIVSPPAGPVVETPAATPQAAPAKYAPSVGRRKRSAS